MLKTAKKLFCVLCAAAVLLSVAVISASAAGSSVMSFSSNSINVGDSVTVKITVRTDGAKDMYGVTGTVNYDPNMFDYVSSTVSANGGGGAIKFAPTATGVQSIVAEFTFKSKAGGSGIFSLTDCQYSNGNDIDVTGSSARVTVNDAVQSSNADLSGVAVLNGFNIGTADYNGAQVAVATDGTYTVYYLKSAESEQPAPFVKNGDSFEPLKYMTIGESVYIFTDKTSADKTPAGFYPTTAKLAGFSVKCYAFENDKMSDFYITECYSNGKYGFYRYDTIQNTLQREPDFKLSENSAKQKDGFITRFNSLPNGGKIIVVCMILTALAIVALIVVFIIKTARGKYTEYPEADDGYDDVFTDITDTDGYVFDSVTEDGETEEIQQTENDEAENDEAEDGEEETSETEQ